VIARSPAVQPGRVDIARLRDTFARRVLGWVDALAGRPDDQRAALLVGRAASATPAVLKKKPRAKPHRHDFPRRAATQPAKKPVAVQVIGGKQNRITAIRSVSARNCAGFGRLPACCSTARALYFGIEPTARTRLSPGSPGRSSRSRPASRHSLGRLGQSLSDGCGSSS
jgi:hypothetical protein